MPPVTSLLPSSPCSLTVSCNKGSPHGCFYRPQRCLAEERAVDLVIDPCICENSVYSSSLLIYSFTHQLRPSNC